ncbi:MAG: BsuBI/PstI family type II restriction endonuclease [Phycisphaerae bacterium]|nr:BsuBI/PstI family type II restriction endonuclease [Phycisphaerae bacterium]
MIITETIDVNRLRISHNLEIAKKNKLGQYFTPSKIATFMASMFADSWDTKFELLDAGCGIGSLFVAFIERMFELKDKPQLLELDAFEIDKTFKIDLDLALRECIKKGYSNGIEITGNIHIEDFIESSVDNINSALFREKYKTYSHAILNPPYKKIQNDSKYRKILRSVGIETSNLYSAFIALVIKQLKSGGQLVAITPRSFCNGPYFNDFRKLLVSNMGIKKIHIFESRDRAFKDDEVLQENIIIHAIKDDFLQAVEITSSSDSNFDDLTFNEVDYNEIVDNADKYNVINVPNIHINGSFKDYLKVFKYSLADIGICASTGKVVDFRSKEYLKALPDKSTAPLLYPAHFDNGFIKYPQIKCKKPNAIIVNDNTKLLLFPRGHYVLTKRFSSKEEYRRIVTSVYDPARIEAEYIGFENHLNVFHKHESGLDENVCKGLAIYLSSTFIDLYFRQFSGHTQVNVADLNRLPYPSIETLFDIGKEFHNEFPNQEEIDYAIEKIKTNGSTIQENTLVKTEKKIREAIEILQALGLPKGQLNDRSGLTLLALLSLKPKDNWSKAKSIMIGITPIMDFCKEHYKRNYAPNTRETFRRQTMHQFVQAGIVVENPDCAARPTNSPNWCYQINEAALTLIRTFRTEAWEKNLKIYLSKISTLKDIYNKERQARKIPVQISKDTKVALTPGEHNELIKKIIEDFCERFTPGGTVLYVGDTGLKFGYCDEKAFEKMGLKIDIHGKMPDVVVHYKKKDWIVLVEAVTSHGPVDAKRRLELSNLFKAIKSKLVYVTCFLKKSDLAKYISDISWETEVWVADNPSHLIHFNGERFLGPYDK